MFWPRNKHFLAFHSLLCLVSQPIPIKPGCASQVRMDPTDMAGPQDHDSGNSTGRWTTMKVLNLLLPLFPYNSPKGGEQSLHPLFST